MEEINDFSENVVKGEDLEGREVKPRFYYGDKGTVSPGGLCFLVEVVR